MRGHPAGSKNVGAVTVAAGADAAAEADAS
jgi:hypothetical protein